VVEFRIRMISFYYNYLAMVMAYDKPVKSGSGLESSINTVDTVTLTISFGSSLTKGIFPPKC
jgi:hypothetical protein